MYWNECKEYIIWQIQHILITGRIMYKFSSERLTYICIFVIWYQSITLRLSDWDLHRPAVDRRLMLDLWRQARDAASMDRPGMLPSSFARRRSNYRNHLMKYSQYMNIKYMYIWIICLDCCQGCCIHTALIDIGGQIRFIKIIHSTQDSHILYIKPEMLHSSTFEHCVALLHRFHQQ